MWRYLTTTITGYIHLNIIKCYSRRSRNNQTAADEQHNSGQQQH
ncbi:MAG TPA: hypothetical protein O0W82_07420 [Methanocorpusculum sp.]|nr:hypothetical protein [Methanocorpusculum sp.]